MKCWITLLGVWYLVVNVHGHGAVIDPPSRGAMSQYGHDEYPQNDDYVGLNCGGLGEQYDKHKGKCGVCGDNYGDPQPRENENGGTYGLGVIAGTYRTGAVLPVTVQVTAAHRGWFYFTICNLDEDEEETEECFDKNKLNLVSGEEGYDLGDQPADYYNIELQLPEDMTCEHCVLRWHYKTGNSWGFCEDGTGALGCGNQETFRSCSDVSISRITTSRGGGAPSDLFQNKMSKLKDRTNQI